MKRNTIFHVALLCAIALSVEPAQMLGGGLTAKSELTKTRALSKKWQTDAVLTSISSLTVSSDGTATSWLHSFYSPSSKRYMIITVKSNSIDTMEVNTGFTRDIGMEFIDSDKAMAEAKKNGLKGHAYSMGLNMMGAAGMNTSPIWSVNGGYEKGDVSVMLDAKTGKFLKKEEMKGF
jgi:hypothetical protein